MGTKQQYDIHGRLQDAPLLRADYDEHGMRVTQQQNDKLRG